MEMKRQEGEPEKSQEEKQEEIREMGTMDLEEGGGREGTPHRIKLITIIGEIEGHEAVSGNTNICCPCWRRLRTVRPSTGSSSF